MPFVTSAVVDHPVDAVFAWHGRLGAIQRLTPSWQRTRILAEADNLRDGEAVLRIGPGYRWVATHRMDGYIPGAQFVDELTSRPAPHGLHWRHTHTFEAAGTDSTRITDTIDTSVPDRMLHRIFAYRQAQLTADLDAQSRVWGAPDGPSTIAITGSSGLVGRSLSALLTTAGHRVIRLVRGPASGPDERTWDPVAPVDDLLDHTDAVIHLAGAPIAGRFTDAHKRAVRDSRVEPTTKLAEVAAGATDGPKVFVSASAIGFYGADRGETVLNESATRGDGFLADVVADWEAATAPAAAAGLRVVTVRTGIVIDPRGGMLGLLGPLYKAGLGGRLGSGRQWFSWIDIDDLCDIYVRSVVDPQIDGPLDAVAPEPVRYTEFNRTLARVLRRPAVLPVPAFAPALLLGKQGAHEFALANQRVRAARLEALGHTFRHPTLDGSLRHRYGRPPRK